jgi:hypothetical protein
MAWRTRRKFYFNVGTNKANPAAADESHGARHEDIHLRDEKKAMFVRRIVPQSIRRFQNKTDMYFLPGK